MIDLKTLCWNKVPSPVTEDEKDEVLLILLVSWLNKNPTSFPTHLKDLASRWDERREYEQWLMVNDREDGDTHPEGLTEW